MILVMIMIMIIFDQLTYVYAGNPWMGRMEQLQHGVHGRRVPTMEVWTGLARVLPRHAL